MRRILTLFLILALFAFSLGVAEAKKSAGGNIVDVPAAVVSRMERECASGKTCQGTVSNTWADISKASCPGGTFSLKPNYPKISLAKDYCATTASKTNTTPTVGQWMLGLYSSIFPTTIGICTCVTSPPTPPKVTIKKVSARLAKTTMFGTSKK